MSKVDFDLQAKCTKIADAAEAHKKAQARLYELEMFESKLKTTLASMPLNLALAGADVESSRAALEQLLNPSAPVKE